MKRKYYVFAILSILLASCGKDDGTPKPIQGQEITFLGKTKITFVSREKAKQLLGTSDVYSRGLSAFDIKSKTQNLRADSESDYLRNAANQAGSWSENEVNNFRMIIASSERKIRALGLKLTLPDEIKLVKSTMNEEGGAAGYTRSNYIVLKTTPDIGLFLHELFHVYSRSNPDKRDQLYATINFKKSNKITYPQSLKDRIINNPDAPILEHYITLTIEAKSQEAVFIIHSERDYNGGSFFNYLKQKLMIVEGDSNSKRAKLVNGQPVLKTFNQAQNLRTLIGNNTNYTLHPEEVLAEHFKLLVNREVVQDQSFLEEMKIVLMK